MLKIYWYRKDLRTDDNRALSAFLRDITANDNYLFLYVKNQDSFNFYGEKRILFLLQSLKNLEKKLNNKQCNLYIYNGTSVDCFKFLLSRYGTIKVFANKQIEPYCIRRDRKVYELLNQFGSEFLLLDDSTLFSPGEIIKDDGTPYSVFTPFKKKCLTVLNENHYSDVKCNFRFLNPSNQFHVESKYNLDDEIRNKNTHITIKGGRENGLKILTDFIKNRVSRYKSQRDFPCVSGTSRISPHLHFGTLNIRECYRNVLNKLSESDNTDDINAWINELLWREFYYHIAYFHPQIEKLSFKPHFDQIKWSDNPELFIKWCKGETGYPIVDAGMLQLREEGWMHNRVRMITAMFLTKDLFIDWRLGEKFFAENLIDLDFASNNGGWQWSASTGCDAQPYFRIFNPYLQSKKFDNEGSYIRKYIKALRNVPDKYIHKPDDIPEKLQKKYGVIIGTDYPYPVVNHYSAKEYAVTSFQKLKSGSD